MGSISKDSLCIHMTRDGKILNIKEVGEYRYAIEKKALLHYGIQVFDRLADFFVLQALKVEETQDSVESTYFFKRDGMEYKRLVRIRPATSSYWRSRGAIVKIIQYRLKTRKG